MSASIRGLFGACAAAAAAVAVPVWAQSTPRRQFQSSASYSGIRLFSDSGLFPVDYVLADGGLAFEGRLQGAGVTGANDVGIWVNDPSEGMELVVREGELFDVGGGDLRVIDRLSFSAGSGFHDARQVAFQATFTDGSSGVFVTVVPELMSGVAVFASLGLAAVFFRRGR